jgi:hypothetical protein
MRYPIGWLFRHLSGSSGRANPRAYNVDAVRNVGPTCKKRLSPGHAVDLSSRAETGRFLQVRARPSPVGPRRPSDRLVRNVRWPRAAGLSAIATGGHFLEVGHSPNTNAVFPGSV